MRRPHVIENLAFGMAFGSEETALAQQAWLERFVKHEALPLVEQVFHEFEADMPDDQSLSIDLIEVDLGATSGRDDGVVLASRLRERLRVALCDAHAAARQGQRGASTKPGRAAELQSMLSFLASGRLHWSHTGSIDALARRVARHDGGALEAELLLAGERGQTMRRRWVAQFGIDGLPELARAWALLERALTDNTLPGWQQAWAVLIDRRPSGLRSLLARLGRNARARRRLLAMLSPAMRDELFALLAGPHRVSLASLVADAVRLGGSHAMVWECLLAHLCLEAAGAALPHAQELIEWADELADPGAPVHLQLGVMLDAMGASGEATGLTAAWRILWRRDRKALRRLVREQGRRGGWRGLTARQVPHEMRQQLLHLLAPGEGEAIGSFMMQACAWHARARGGAQAGFEDWLWQQTLALVTAQGAAPTAASCIAALLQKIAQAQRVAAATLAADLRTLLRDAQPGLAASQQLLQILHDCDDRPAVAVDRRIAALCSRLQQQVPLSIDECRHWQAEAGLLLAQHADALRPALRVALGAPQTAARLTALLPTPMLEDVLKLLRPRDHERARQCVKLVGQACEAVDPAVMPRVASLGWQFLLQDLVAEGRRFAASAMSGRFLDYLAGKLGWKGNKERRRAIGGAADRLAGAAAAPLARDVAAGLVSCEPDAPPTDISGSPAWSDYLSNAGIVLLVPYLPRLFATLDLLKNQAFVDEAAAERALHLLHFLATGEEGAPETALLLPKLLCGVDSGLPVAREAGLLPREQEAIEGLLGAAIGHWKALGHTSISGLRETFLQRDGRLLRDGDAWRLEVAAGTFDMLLDQLPWGYRTIKLPWMTEVLHVEWR